VVHAVQPAFADAARDRVGVEPAFDEFAVPDQAVLSRSAACGTQIRRCVEKLARATNHSTRRLRLRISAA
jgi:hypothetical protein